VDEHDFLTISLFLVRAVVVVVGFLVEEINRFNSLAKKQEKS